MTNRPTVVLEDVPVDLPDERDQLSTRSTPKFAQLRAHMYGQIQLAKQGYGQGNKERRQRGRFPLLAAGALRVFLPSTDHTS
ncbi:hypothetical protein [Amycolatopsis thermoflava]|uniref:hypothetical protein n=1 Tax=Amycolatopsis thermoflava TaxID=84480 RepID=UPI00365AA1CF